MNELASDNVLTLADKSINMGGYSWTKYEWKDNCQALAQAVIDLWPLKDRIAELEAKLASAQAERNEYFTERNQFSTKASALRITLDEVNKRIAEDEKRVVQMTAKAIIERDDKIEKLEAEIARLRGPWLDDLERQIDSLGGTSRSSFEMGYSDGVRDAQLKVENARKALNETSNAKKELEQ